MENRLPLPYISALNRLYGYTPRQGLALKKNDSFLL